jgi:hypothetical protein
MFVAKNRKNRTYFVGNRGKDGLNVYYSVSLPKAKRRSMLTLKLGDKRIDLTGRQVRLLKEILQKGTELSN